MKRRIVTPLTVLGAVGLAYYAAQYAIDFFVYWQTARVFFHWGGPVYGSETGMAWPMWYRYPPLFLFAFWPVSRLPLETAAMAWALLKCGALAWLAVAVRRRTGGSWKHLPIAACIAAPYVFLEIRYGNAQFLVFALAAAGLFQLSRRPRAASALLGFAAAIKLWPVFFFPILAAAKRRLEAVWAVAAMGLLSALPALHLGWDEHRRLLVQWWEQESEIVASAVEIWFPSQSLLGVMSRYLVEIPYERLPDPDYPAINLVSLDASLVYAVWIVIALACFGWLLWFASRHWVTSPLEVIALSFCVLVFIEPYTQKQIALTVLALPALVAAFRARVMPAWGRQCLYAAAVIGVAQPLLGRHQKLLQVLGADVALTVLLALSLLSLLKYPSPTAKKRPLDRSVSPAPDDSTFVNPTPNALLTAMAARADLKTNVREEM